MASSSGLPAKDPIGSTIEAISTDPRVHFDRQSGKWAYETEDGTEREWDDVRKVWMDVVDEDLIAAQQRAYGEVDHTEPSGPILARDKKRKKAAEGDSQNKRQKPPPRNTSVYVTGLPTEPPYTATLEEVHEVFSKAGMILEDVDGQPKIKFYNDANGRFKGEALVVYLNDASVQLAVQLLDQTELRMGQASRDGVMSVQEALWDHKKSENTENGSETKGGRKAKPDPNKQKAQRKAEKQRDKLTDWDSDDESTVAQKLPQGGRIVVLAHMFTLEELEADPKLLLELKEDVRDECEEIGKITNVTLYDKEPEGIMTIKFADPIAAQACVIKMQGRYFAGRRVIAGIFDGTKRFQRSGRDDDDDSGKTEAQRLEEFANWLETEADD